MKKLILSLSVLFYTSYAFSQAYDYNYGVNGQNG